MSAIQAITAIFRDDVVPVLRCSTSTGIAPLGVVFDGAITSSDVQNFSDLTYFFDYGDPGADTFTNGMYQGKTKNKQVGGPEGVYVYTSTGTFTASMWVHDGIRMWGPVSKTITVDSADSYYSGNNTICISTSGDFTNAPPGSLQITTSSYKTAIDTYLKTGKRVLFRASETFLLSASVGFSGQNNFYLGSYGTGPRPIVLYTGTDISAFAIFAAGSIVANNPYNGKIENLNFQGGESTGTTSGITGVGTGGSPADPSTMVGNYVINNCNFDYVGTPLSFTNLKNLVVNKCSFTYVARGIPTGGQIGLYVAGFHQFGIIDCNFNNEFGGEHVTRIQGGKIAAIISSEFRRTQGIRQLLTIRGSSSYETEYITVAGNMIDGRLSTNNWLMTIAPQNTTSFEPISRIVLESNYFIACDGPSQVALVLESDYIHINNNVFHLHSTSTQSGMNFITLRVANTVGLNPPSNVSIKYNTFYNEKSTFSGIFISSTATNTKIYGNLAYAPNAISSTVISGTGIDTTSSFNTTDLQVTTINPLFLGVTTGSNSFAGFQISTSSFYVNSGTNFNVYTDAQGNLRNNVGLWDLGAINSAGKQVDAWTLI